MIERRLAREGKSSCFVPKPTHAVTRLNLGAGFPDCFIHRSGGCLRLLRICLWACSSRQIALPSVPYAPRKLTAMPWGHSATLRVRPAVSRRCSPMIPGRLRQPFPCVSSIRPSKSTSGLSPHNAPSAAWTTSPHGIHPRPKPRLTMQVLTSPLRPPHQCRAVIARSVGDPFAPDDPQPRQRLLRTRVPAEASLLRTDAVVLRTATSAANSRPLPSAAIHHPDGLPGQGQGTDIGVSAGTLQPRGAAAHTVARPRRSLGSLQRSRATSHLRH